MRRVLLGLLLVVVLAIGGVVLVFNFLATGAIGEAATAALGVETRLSRFLLVPFAGRVTLGGLSIANPPGFESEHFLKLGGGDVRLKVGSLLSDPIIVESIALDGVAVTLERNRSGTNYGKILDNLGTGQSAPAASGEESAGPNLVIRKLVIRDISATVKVEVVGRKIADTTVSVPEIVLQNLGSPESGITMRELAALLTRKLLEGVSKAGGGIPTDLASDLRGSLSGLASSGSAGEARDTAEKAMDSVKGLFGRD